MLNGYMNINQHDEKSLTLIETYLSILILHKYFEYFSLHLYIMSLISNNLKPRYITNIQGTV